MRRAIVAALIETLGEDDYRVMLWPGQPRELSVRKCSFWCCRAGRHV